MYSRQPMYVYGDYTQLLSTDPNEVFTSHECTQTILMMMTMQTTLCAQLKLISWYRNHYIHNNVKMCNKTFKTYVFRYIRLLCLSFNASLSEQIKNEQTFRTININKIKVDRQCDARRGKYTWMCRNFIPSKFLLVSTIVRKYFGYTMLLLLVVSLTWYIVTAMNILKLGDNGSWSLLAVSVPESI